MMTSIADPPSDAVLQQQLRDSAVSTFETSEEVTVNDIRAHAEKVLGLPASFFKKSTTWHVRSKEIIHDERDKLADAQQDDDSQSAVPEEPAIEEASLGEPAPEDDDQLSPPVNKRKNCTKAKIIPSDEDTMQLSNPQSSKRKISERPEKAEKPHKRRKTISSSPAAQSSPDRTTSPSPFPTKAKEPDEKGSDKETSEDPITKQPIHDDSDLSSLVDDSPPPVKRKKPPPSSSSSTKPSKSNGNAKNSAPKAKSAKLTTDLSPEEAQIKTLQQQLLKCGVRKIWGIYLQQFDTPKQKILHLRSMLKDVGMIGRFSEQRAQQIKEERELKADIDDITANEMKWGRREDKEDPGQGPRKRLVPKGLQGLEGLADDEESD